MEKNPDRVICRGFLKGAWRCPTLTWGGPTLPSAISHFTAGRLRRWKADGIRWFFPHSKNPDRINDQGFLKGAWRCPTLTWGGPTLPSAISHFTAEFGMGSGGSNFLWSPGLFVLSYGLCVMSTPPTLESNS